ncbi:MAG: FliM/FliN family flagellar motor switch protein [Sphingopyxis sp.]
MAESLQGISHPKNEDDDVSNISASISAPELPAFGDVNVRLSVEVGSANISLSELLRLQKDNVVILNKSPNDLLEIYANGTIIAKGQVILDKDHYAIQLCEIVSDPDSYPARERRRV